MFFKIESWNFQHLFENKFRETSQNFNSIRQQIQNMETEISEWVEILWGFTKFFFKQMLKFQLSILKIKKVLFLKKYHLSRSLKIDQDNSIRWRLLSLFSVTVLVWASPVINNKSQGLSFDWIFTTSNMKSLVVLSLLNYQWTSHKPMYSPFISP